MDDNYFGWVDYVVFGVMLLCSALIGVYFAFFAKQKQNTTTEYLMGGKKMGIVPISMSLIASFTSGITTLGIPAEVYVFGTMYWWTVCSRALALLTMSFVFLPVYHKLQLTSCYEYLQFRFNQPVRLLCSCFYTIRTLLFIPIYVYGPALAFNQVTGVNVHYVTPVVCVVCIFYTSLGGLKAVVWTDTLQATLMVGGSVVIAVLGTLQVGGVSEVIARNRDSHRLEFFNMNPDPTARLTFWTVQGGGYFFWLSEMCVNQVMVQRCIAMSSVRRANIVLSVVAAGFIITLSLSCAIGLITYAFFHDCDPLTTNMIVKSDQILPYFVMKIFNSLPGLPGIFMAAVFSAALSSMSTGLNSLTGVIFEDFFRPMVKHPISEARASTVMKTVAAVLGVVCVALVFVVEKVGGMLQAADSLVSVVSGPMLGIFTLGMCCPWVNSKGALAGGLTSFVLGAWMSFGSQWQISQGHITFPKKDVSIDGCPSDIFNSTVLLPETPTGDDVLWLYRISYMWYTAIGMLLTITVGLVVSFFTGSCDVRDVHRDLLTPVIHRFLPPTREHAEEEAVKLNTVEQLGEWGRAGIRLVESRIL